MQSADTARDIPGSLRIYNTLSRNKQPLVPLEPGKLRIYVCGMTVYDYCHLGHARVLVAFDVIVRYLRAIGYEVTYVRNITDIDDKILQRAQENNEPFTALTARYIRAMHEDERALQVLPPDHEPRATEHIEGMLAMIQTLMDNGYAYQADNGDVYYAVARFPRYGQLSGRNMDELLAGARVEVDEAKHDPRDFVLWKAAKPGEVSWPSPWGAGRPGWHIECSAMSTSCLGDSFDIHGGGPDLRFPHHENEIAQSEAATGKTYVNYWMHAGAVRLDGEKMSKSLGNFFTIRDILAEHHPEVVRYLLIASHYRSGINYSADTLQEARQGLERFYLALQPYADEPALPWQQAVTHAWGQRFAAAMNDDFNTPGALAVLFDLVRELNASNAEQGRQLAALLKGLAATLGLLQSAPAAFLQAGFGLAAAEIEALIAERNAAKGNRDFARADAIRQQLLEQGVVLEDTREGTRWRRE